MIPIHKLDPQQTVVTQSLGFGQTSEGEDFEAFNVVGESGIIMKFKQDNADRWMVRMVDVINGIVAFRKMTNQLIRAEEVEKGHGEGVRVSPDPGGPGPQADVVVGSGKPLP
jgi:hypothetical protein